MGNLIVLILKVIGILAVVAFGVLLIVVVSVLADDAERTRAKKEQWPRVLYFVALSIFLLISLGVINDTLAVVLPCCVAALAIILLEL